MLPMIKCEHFSVKAQTGPVVLLWLWNRLTQVHHLCRHVLDQPSVQDHVAGGGWWPRRWWGGVQLFSSPHAEGPPQISPPRSGHAHHWLCYLWGENGVLSLCSPQGLFTYQHDLISKILLQHIFVYFFPPFFFFSTDSRRGRQSLNYYHCSFDQNVIITTEPWVSVHCVLKSSDRKLSLDWDIQSITIHHIVESIQIFNCAIKKSFFKFDSNKSRLGVHCDGFKSFHTWFPSRMKVRFHWDAVRCVMLCKNDRQWCKVYIISIKCT